MIKEQELREAIAECQGERNPNANTCIKLAAYYSILDHMAIPDPGYSFAASPEPADHELVTLESESEFAQAIQGQPVADVMPLIDELMDAVRVLQPKLYRSVMRRIMGEN